MAAARLVVRSARRLCTTAAGNNVIQPHQSLDTNTNTPTAVAQGWLFIDSVFPIQLGRWDPRRSLGLLRSPTLLSDLQDRLNQLTARNFRVLSIEPQTKDGGVFVKFSYVPSQGDTPESLEQALQDQISEDGSLPSWAGLYKSNVWLVKGIPWREDLSRFASPILKVTFEGPDIHEEKLYQLLRPYGHIHDLSAPTPVPAGTSRSAILAYTRPRSAVIARNVLHGLKVDGTVIRLNYQKPIQAHAVRDWMGSHPKIMLPLIVFLLGSLTYTIFDPIRSFMVQGKLDDWFDYQKYKLYQWLQRNALDHLSLDASSTLLPSQHKEATLEESWKERKQAESSIKAYLTDTPNTVAFIHGPQGSGKTSMVKHIITESGRTALVIDCRQLLNGTLDSQIVGDLASQTGYWPVFTFLNSMNSLIDLASVGLIGQKTGLSSSLPDQVQQILTVVGRALHRVYVSRRHDAQKRVIKEENNRKAAEEVDRRRARIRNGTWHDGRLDCVSGSGIMCELGVGDEIWDSDDMVTGPALSGLEKESLQDGKQKVVHKRAEEETKKKRAEADVEAIGALPIVIIRNFDSKTLGGMGLAASSTTREDVLNVLASWAGSLVENQLAHVIVISDNRENAKKLAQALPSKPLNSIALYDADPTSSLAFVKQKLQDAGVNASFTGDEVKYLQRLGGRASDLESLIHKVRNGQTVQGAVDDIITRAVSELRKSAFGDDTDDAKGRPWAREQAWKVVKVLSTKSEVPYYDILIDFPFKGDDNALRGMENAELIAIGTQEGRPSTIRPGKPVYRWVFEKLVNDSVFRATQEIAFNEKQISSSETLIQKCESELQQLKTLEDMESGWFRWLGGSRRGIRERERLLLRKLGEANRKVEELERMNRELKGVIKRGV